MFMSFYLLLNDPFVWETNITFSGSIVWKYFLSFGRFIIFFFAGFYFLLTAEALHSQKLSNFEYVALILFAVLGLSIMNSSNDILTGYLTIKLSGLALYLLIAYKKNLYILPIVG